MKTSVQGLKSLASKPTITKSQFPRAPFLVVRLLQFISACVVLGINGYFIYNLVHDHYSVPWEFTLLDIVVRLPLSISIPLCDSLPEADTHFLLRLPSPSSTC